MSENICCETCKYYECDIDKNPCRDCTCFEGVFDEDPYPY